MEAERNDTMTNTHISIPKTIQSARHMNLEYNETIRQKGSRTKTHENAANNCITKKLFTTMRSGWISMKLETLCCYYKTVTLKKWTQLHQHILQPVSTYDKAVNV